MPKQEFVLEEALKKKYEHEPYVMVWFCKTIQNKKGLFYFPGKEIFVEATLNGDEHEVYLDEYVKQNKTTIKVE